MKKLNEEEKDRVNMWKFLLTQFGKWNEDDEILFKRIVYGEEKK